MCAENDGLDHQGLALRGEKSRREAFIGIGDVTGCRAGSYRLSIIGPMIMRQCIDDDARPRGPAGMLCRWYSSCLKEGWLSWKKKSGMWHFTPCVSACSERILCPGQQANDDASTARIPVMSSVSLHPSQLVSHYVHCTTIYSMRGN